MKRKNYSYVITLLLINTMLCAVGCSTEAKGPVATAKPVSQQPPEGQLSSPPTHDNEEATLRCVAEPVDGPGRFVEGCFVDEKHAWVWAGGSPRRTTDGGHSWQRIRPSDEATHPNKWSEGLFLRVSSITPARAWLTGDHSTWQTDDGGMTWRRLFPKGSSPPIFADSNHGWLTVEISDSSTQSYVTTDGGETWRPCGPALDDKMQAPAGRAHFLTSQLGWVITSRTVERQTLYGVARSIDGGCRWKQMWTSDQNPDERYSSIYFLNEREGWLAGGANGSLYQTTGGGKEWKEVPLPKQDLKVLDVYFEASDRGWIKAAPGVYSTTDGGKTWQEFSEREFARGLYVTDPRNGLPPAWKAGRLMRTVYANEHTGGADQVR